MKAYTVLFSIDFRHFEVKGIKINDERTISYRVGGTTYNLNVRLHEVSEDPTSGHTGTGFVNVKDQNTGYNKILVCTIAKR